MKKHILIILIAASFVFMKQADDKFIKGRVTDVKTGTPVAGVQVIVKGTFVHTQTDREGKYNISLPENKWVLIFSHPDYQFKEIRITGINSPRLDVKLKRQGESEIEESTSQQQDLKKQKPSPLSRIKSQAYYTNGSAAEIPAVTEPYRHSFNTEEYDHIREAGFQSPLHHPLSTFSIDVDGASYSNVRRMLENGQKPLKDAVRIEEFINYFDYDYSQPEGKHPFSISTEISQAPWNKKHYLVHIGLQGKEMDKPRETANNLVFLIDVSGSMSAANKLPLLKSAFKLLLNELGPNDRIAIVAYAGAAGLVLPSTPVVNKSSIQAALNKLQAGGSTAGGQGIKLAYKVARENLIAGGNNRVILATDGDFNIGVSSTSELVRMVEEKKKEGIYLTITGFGMGNLKDGRMEQISNAGNGNYYYIDHFKEAKKVFVDEMQSTLYTIAKDVKLQIEFNPQHVQAYRLIGYENRMLKSEDFNDDKKDAGELGAGHTVTALYEVIPSGIDSEYVKSVDKLKYQKNQVQKTYAQDLMTVKFRYKNPTEEHSNLIKHAISRLVTPLNETSDNFRFSASVAGFGMLLRESEYRGDLSYEELAALALSAKGRDVYGYRAEFVSLVRTQALLARN